MIIYDSTKGDLPNDNEYVVARYTGGNWYDKHDQEGCVWKVVKFEKGLTKEENKLNKFSQCDEHGNNLKPYCWKEFGPDCIFGQNVDLWFRLPRELNKIAYQSKRGF